MIRYTYDYINQIYTMDSTLNKDVGTIVDGFVYYKQYKNFENGQTPGRRAAFIKTHGGARAKFTISHAEIDAGKPYAAAIKQGLFAKEAQYDAWVRFGSDVNFEQSDRHSTVGCSIKLFNVPGQNVLDYPVSKDSESQFTTVDFAMQNYKVFFARDAQQMAAYKAASLEGPDALNEFKQKPENKVLADTISSMMALNPSSALTETYWSCVPFILGTPKVGGVIQLCKYILTPSKNQTTAPPQDKGDHSFLRDDLAENLKSSPYSFDFYIHLKTLAAQSGENASDNWEAADNSKPEVSPFGTNDVDNIHKIGTLEIFQQDITQRGQDDYIESLAFNPWRTLPDNIPYGEIALARRISYEIAAKSRRDLNGQSVGEPVAPRPLAFNDAQYGAPEHDVPWSDVSHNTAPDTAIVRVAIHPGIGIARVGNSELAGSDWMVGEGDYADIYIGPETDTPDPMRPDQIRDDSGRIKRQAARFRLYGFNAAGQVVREILPGDPNTEVKWSATLANRKAQWFNFDHAWDKTFFELEEKSPSDLRNKSVSDRASLAITPDNVSISGVSQRSPAITGQFQSVDVALGELRTDDKGRLLVLGGKGRADTTAAPSDPDHNVLNGNHGSFNNAENWYDDISDGPIHAHVTIDGKEYEADSAWVVVAPPNYAPDIIGFRTLYELLEEIYIEAGMLPMPKEVSFTKHILPSLQRLSNLSWVNKGFHDLFGPGQKYDFTDSALIDNLRRQPQGGIDTYKSMRAEILKNFQSPYSTDCNPHNWPLLYGDSFGEDVPTRDASTPFLNIGNPEDMSSLSNIRYAWFKKWADGDFVDDTEPSPPIHASIDDVPLNDQPAMLDKAALHFCLADAFHPGCETTWPMRHLSIYRAPYRIREAATDDIYVPAKGEQFEYQAAQIPSGGLAAQPPGGLTRWMALPWHGDTARCRAGYDAGYSDEETGDYGQYTPTYWPARVPNHVLSQENYGILMSKFNSKDDRKKAFNARDKWWRNLSDDADSRDPSEEELQAQYMIKNFHKMGIVLQSNGPDDLEGVPEKVYFENLSVDQ